MTTISTRGILIVGTITILLFLTYRVERQFYTDNFLKELDFGAIHVRYDVSSRGELPFSPDGYLRINEISAESSIYENGACVNVESNEVDSHLFYKFHEYTTFVNVRFIVLTYNRSKSLAKVLKSLQNMELDGHNATVEIWLDRSKAGRIDTRTLDVAMSFCWNRGPVFVHVHSQHAGLYGQWINTWASPEKVVPVEIETLAIYLEDDTDISRYAYRWLRSAHVTYGHLSDLIGYSLQDENVIVATGIKKHTELKKKGKGLVYGYPVPGSWGFAPHPARWSDFQTWFVQSYSNSSFKPYTNNATLHTDWYKTFEKKHKEDSMWTMWMIRFCWEFNFFSIYSNLPSALKNKRTSLVSNRKEAGLHYGKSLSRGPVVMSKWNEAAIKFPTQLKIYDYAGKYKETKTVIKSHNKNRI